MNELEGEKGHCVALRGTTRQHNGKVMYLSTIVSGSEEGWGRMHVWYKKFIVMWHNTK